MNANGVKLTTFDRLLNISSLIALLIALIVFFNSMSFRVDESEKRIAEFEHRFMSKELIEAKLNMIEEDLAEIKQLVRESNR